MPENKLGYVHVAYDQLADLLPPEVPVGSEIRGIREYSGGMARGYFAVIIEHESLSPVYEGGELPVIAALPDHSESSHRRVPPQLLAHIQRVIGQASMCWSFDEERQAIEHDESKIQYLANSLINAIANELDRARGWPLSGEVATIIS